MGGKVSGTVHRKVDYVLTSDRAVRGATQKIRKAIKIGIPLLHIDFLAYCRKHRAAPNELSPYLIDEEQVELKSKKADDSSDQKGEKKSLHKTKEVSAVFVYQCTCGCICHDNGEDSCKWCEGAHSTSQVQTGSDTPSHVVENTSQSNKEETTKEIKSPPAVRTKRLLLSPGEEDDGKSCARSSSTDCRKVQISRDGMTATSAKRRRRQKTRKNVDGSLQDRTWG
mmetsp:Transcript_26453/g.43662  ORF Transcript_26453/g.43662 Transcript_26453/m.43662 type:complete len:225 (-) Transcript_26453:127-801(-)